MKLYDVIQVLQTKKDCLLRKCNHKCSNCDLFVDEDDLKEAYRLAINILSRQKQIKVEFFNSGVEYAKNEFARKLEREKNHVGELHKSKAVDDLVYTQVLGLQKAIELIDEIYLQEKST